MKGKNGNFMGRIRNKFYTGLAATALGISSLAGYSCSDGPTQPKIHNPPAINLSVSPTSGTAPLEVRVQGKCTDSDNNPITYKVMLNGNAITSTNPTDTTVTLNQDSYFSSQCNDDFGNTVNAGPKNVSVVQPAMSETATLSDSININYTATLSNVSQAIRKTLINGALITTDTITGPSYSQTISKAKKGDYEFILTTNNPLVNPDTAKVTVPDYPTIVDFSGLQTDTTENGVIGFNLASRIKDENPEDNPGHVAGAVSLDSKTKVTINGDSATITALGDSTGQYRVQFNIKNATGIVDSSVFQGTIYDVPRISGNFQDSKTWQGTQGTMLFSTINGTDTIPLMTQSSNSAGQNITDSTGKFDFKIMKRSSQLENILLRVWEGIPGDSTGYVRSINLSPKDTSGLLLRGVRFPTSIDPDSFYVFMQKLSPRFFDFDGIACGVGYKGIEVPSFEGLNFSPSTQDTIKARILDPNGINALVRGRITANSIIFGNQGHYIIDSSTMTITPDTGWIIVVPDTSILGEYGHTGLTTSWYGGGGAECAAVVYLYYPPWATAVSDKGLSHEMGHVFLGSGEPSMLPNETVMNNVSPLLTPGPADIKAGSEIIYDPTKIVDNGILLPRLDGLSNILGNNYK